MGVALKVGERSFEIGQWTLFNAFFSSIAVRAEADRWGSRFPALMNGLYHGRMDAAVASTALRELDDIQQALAGCEPRDVVWDFEDRSARPPWGDNISPTITSLANYFVTSHGRDLFQVLRDALRYASETGQEVRVD